MSKFNKPLTAEQVVSRKPGATTNFEGGLAYELDIKTKLMKMTATSLVGENKFYTSGEKADSEILDLIHAVAQKDPEFILKLALYTREVLRLRSAPVMLIAEIANANVGGIPNSRRYVERTIQRVDEITELLAYQLERNSQNPRNSKLPMLLKNGVGRAFNKFDEYQFAKYDRDGAVTLRDALFMTHPKPKDAKQQRLFDKIVNGELETPETWQTYISEHGSNNKSWTHIAPKMPIFALVRNLRNLLQNNVDTDLYTDKLRNKKVIQRSRMFPFRFYSAYVTVAREVPTSIEQREVLDALEDSITLSIANIPKIEGRTAIFCDLSGSMGDTVSSKSHVRYVDIGTLFGAMADQICDKSIVGAFGEHFDTVDMPKRMPIFQKMMQFNNVNVGGATNAWKAIDWLIKTNTKVDRVMVFSDEQVYNTDHHYIGYSWGPKDKSETLQAKMQVYRNKINPNAYLHSFDLSGYPTTMIPNDDPKSNLVAGWSEQIFNYIELYEKGFATMVDIVENYPVD